MKTTLIVIGILIVIAAGYFLFRNSYKSTNNSSSNITVTTNAVTISNFAFSPSSVSIKAGETVTFTNNDGTNHTVTADGGSFDKPIAPGESITIQISNPGTYTYHCKIHSSMTGTIVVN